MKPLRLDHLISGIRSLTVVVQNAPLVQLSRHRPLLPLAWPSVVAASPPTPSFVPYRD